jgi:PilZ domain-containing protein
MERRQHRRKRVLWHAQVQTLAGDFECRVVSLSPRGVSIEIDHPLAPKEVVTLIMEPLGEFTGFVVWRRKGAAGIQITERCATRTEITLPRWIAKLRPASSGEAWWNPPGSAQVVTPDRAKRLRRFDA